MADTSYPKGMQRLLNGSINLGTAPLKVCLVTAGYTYSTAHEFVSDLGTRVGVDQALTNVSITGGVLDADDLDFGLLAPGSALKAVVIYLDTGAPSTSPLLLYLDQLAGFPMTTNGGGVTIPWSDGTKKIARIAGTFYPKGAALTMGGGVNWGTDALKVALVPAGYSRDEAHEFLSDLGTPLATQAMAGRTTTGGVFDAADNDFGAQAGPGVVGGVAIFKDTGASATSPLLIYTEDVIGFPFTLNGSGVKVVWPDVATRIFSLVPA